MAKNRNETAPPRDPTTERLQHLEERVTALENRPQTAVLTTPNRKTIDQLKHEELADLMANRDGHIQRKVGYGLAPDAAAVAVEKRIAYLKKELSD